MAIDIRISNNIISQKLSDAWLYFAKFVYWISLLADKQIYYV